MIKPKTRSTKSNLKSIAFGTLVIGALILKCALWYETAPNIRNGAVVYLDDYQKQLQERADQRYQELYGTKNK